MIDLSKNEFPFCYCKKFNINLYPSLKKIEYLKKKTSYFFNTKKLITFGNGSDDLINFLICKFKNIASIFPTFIMYYKFSTLHKKKYISFVLNSKFNFNEKKLANYINILKIEIFFICYPNNPTGNLFNKNKIIFLLKNCKKTFFVIDEVYSFFSKKTLLNLDFKNIIILKSFSKIGYAGVRIGIMFSNFNFGFKNPYSNNLFSLYYINKIIKNFKFLKNEINYVIKERNRIYKKKKNILINTKTNFLLCKKKIKINFFIFRYVKIGKKTFTRFSISKKEINDFLINKI
ncbi:aminotransferase class I/II-fold pyridoxal phosphate-dependent enzyme [Candidatus Vidania fulgoroideorum]